MSPLDEETLDHYRRLVSIKGDECRDEYIKKALQQLSAIERTCLLLQIEGEFDVEDIVYIVDGNREEVAAAIRNARKHVCQYYHDLIKQANRRKVFISPRVLFLPVLLVKKAMGRAIPHAGGYERGIAPTSARRRAIIGVIALVISLLFSLALPLSSLAPTLAASLSWPNTTTLQLPQSGVTSTHTVSWSPDGKHIAVLWDDSTLQVFDARTYQSIFSEPVAWGYGLAWSPDGKYLATVGEDAYTIQIWDILTLRCKVNTLHHCLIYTGHTAEIKAIAWSPNGKDIASASDDQTVQIWDANTMKQRYTYHDPGSKVTAIAWSHDGKRLVSGDNYGHIQAWDAFTGAHLVNYRGHMGAITFLCWSPDGNALLSSSYDGTLRIWNVRNGSSDVVYHSQDPIFAAAISSGESENNGYLALVVGSSVQIWQITDQQGKWVPKGLTPPYNPTSRQRNLKPRDNIVSISWSPYGGHLIAGGIEAILEFHPGA